MAHQPQSAVKIIIFDCDGVMFDSRLANKEYYNHLLLHFGRPVMDENELDFVHMHNVKDSIRHIFRNHSDLNPDEVDAYRRSLDYSPFFRYMQIEEDLVPFLEYAQGKFDLAISTNRTTTMIPLLRAFNLIDYFGKVMTADNAKRPKPAPDALFEILDYFGHRTEDAIYIGDSIIDRQHTEAAGIRLIAFKNPALPAEFHVNRFMDVLALPPFSS